MFGVHSHSELGVGRTLLLSCICSLFFYSVSIFRKKLPLKRTVSLAHFTSLPVMSKIFLLTLVDSLCIAHLDRAGQESIENQCREWHSENFSSNKDENVDSL